VADVAAAIRAGFYTVGLAGGVEAMSQTPMAWEGGVNPRAAKNKKAMSCLIPMGAHRTVQPLLLCITFMDILLLCPFLACRLKSQAHMRHLQRNQIDRLVFVSST